MQDGYLFPLHVYYLTPFLQAQLHSLMHFSGKVKALSSWMMLIVVLRMIHHSFNVSILMTLILVNIIVYILKMLLLYATVSWGMCMHTACIIVHSCSHCRFKFHNSFLSTSKLRIIWDLRWYAFYGLIPYQ